MLINIFNLDILLSDIDRLDFLCYFKVADIQPCRSGGMVDTYVSGAYGEICVGSSPISDIKKGIT